MRYLAALGGLIVAGVLAMGGSAAAGPVILINSTTDTVFHPELLYFSGSSFYDNEAASFQNGAVKEAIEALTLGLGCQPAGCGSYAGNGTVQTAVTNSNQVTLSNVTGYAIGDLVEGGGIAANKVYITNINTNTNTLTLSGNVTVSKSVTVKYLTLGEITIGLYGNSVSGAPSGNPSPDVPGAMLGHFNEYDAQLIIQNSLVESSASGGQDTFVNPFGGTLLQPNTTYWIELVDDQADPQTTLLGWDLVSGNSPTGINGTNVSSNDWTISNYANSGSSSCGSVNSGSSAFLCSFQNGGNRGLYTSSHGIGLDFEVVAPEPASMAVLGTGLIGLGLLRRRRTDAAS